MSIERALSSALKSLRRRKLLTLATALLFALGVGLDYVVRTAFAALSDDPFPERVGELHRVVMQSGAGADGKGAALAERGLVSRVQSDRIRAELPEFVHVATYATRGVVTVAGVPELATIRLADAQFFRQFAVPFAAGGAWGDDLAAHGDFVAVIDASLARRWFGTRPAVGESFEFRGHAFRVLGVVGPWQPRPRFYDTSTDAYAPPEQIFVPLALADRLQARPAGMLHCADERDTSDYARLRGSDCRWLQHWIATQSPQQARRLANSIRSDSAWAPIALMPWLRASGAIGEWSLLAYLAGIGFLVVCATNAIWLSTARTLQRLPALNVRRALGAGPGDIALELLVEALLLGAAGAVAGIAAGALVLRFASFGLALDGHQDAFNLGVAWSALLVGCAAAILAAVPAVGLALRSEPREGLTESTAGGGGGRFVPRLMSVIAVAQIAITFAITLYGAHLATRVLRNLDAPAGFDLEGTLGVTTRWMGPSTQEVGLREADLRALRAIPGVVDASEITAYPLSGGGWVMDVGAGPGGALPVPAAIYSTDEHGLAALGSRLVAGRDFTASDVGDLWPDGAPFARSVIVSRDLARSLYGTGSALGRRVYFTESDSAEIVGVVEDLHSPFVDGDGLNHALLMPWREHGGPSRYVIRTQEGQRDLVAAQVTKVLRAVEPQRIIEDVRPLRDMRDEAFAPQLASLRAMVALLTTILGATALGLYAQVNERLQRSTREIALRFALGATASRVTGGLLSMGLVHSSLAVVLGTISAIALHRVLSNDGSNPLSYGWTAAFVVAGFVGLPALITLLSCRRLARLPPALVLRN